MISRPRWTARRAMSPTRKRRGCGLPAKARSECRGLARRERLPAGPLLRGLACDPGVRRSRARLHRLRAVVGAVRPGRAREGCTATDAACQGRSRRAGIPLSTLGGFLAVRGHLTLSLTPLFVSIVSISSGNHQSQAPRQ